MKINSQKSSKQTHKYIKHIELAPYNPDWPKLYESEAARIKQALGDNYIAIHHVGSTSVPSLIAKPKIDIIAVVVDLQRSIKTLEQIGAEYRGEYNIPGRYFFRKRGGIDVNLHGDIDVNLHIYEKDHPEIELNLMFRDYLRTHPAARDQYALLKQKLLQDKSSFEKNHRTFTEYTMRKGDFIREILKDAGFSSVRIIRCSDQTEWSAAKKLRKQYFTNIKSNDPNDLESCYLNAQNAPSAPAARRAFMDEDEHLALYKGPEIIGYSHIHLPGNNKPVIRILIIDENHHGQGFEEKFLTLIREFIIAS
ncbi:MAG: GNAT family N-acetyltransferase [Rickettsiales bacterium]|nr:MAG: GNAT family N-acetyltransferase [Rickettsiales bacterium]